ncbi:hypothetical protein [Maricaulis sp.]|uniref:hypothetical protein n=1 Tax=Maricaulis sp. TaxID=1486257 RepID=UPI003A8F00E2
MSADSLAPLLAEIRGRVELISASLPSEVDPAAYIEVGKLPLKVHHLRECLIWRMEELSRTALSAFEADDKAAGIILTRAALECVAMTWYTDKNVALAIETGDRHTLNETATRLLLGWKTEADLPAAINVQTMINQAAKSVPEIKTAYDILSEVAHPNYRGMAFLYSKIDQEKILVNFGKSVRKTNIKKHGAESLNASLIVFESAYDRLGDRIQLLVDRTR